MVKLIVFCSIRHTMFTGPRKEKQWIIPISYSAYDNRIVVCHVDLIDDVEGVVVDIVLKLPTESEFFVSFSRFTENL